MLAKLGWDDAWSAALTDLQVRSGTSELIAGRVLRQDRGWLRVATESGEQQVQLTGKLTHAAASALDLPTVGDWVALDGSREAKVVAVLPRRSLLARRSGEEAQSFAANLDLAFVVHGLDQPLNLRRIERGLAMVAASGAEPVVVLNKADLREDAAAAVAEVQTLARGAAVVLASAEAGRGIAELEARLSRGRTGVLLGASGVGKSSLANRLLGEARLATGAVRASDAKGRHTTTHRELFVLPGGGLLVDGPGVRELGIFEAGLAQTFPEIEALAGGCRFRDCAHDAEPGCAVRGAVEAGQLEPARLQSFHRLAREVAAAAAGQAAPSGRAARSRKR